MTTSTTPADARPQHRQPAGRKLTTDAGDNGSTALSDLAARALGAWNRHDVAAILADYSPDAVHDAHDGTPPTAGRDAIATRCQDILTSSPSLQFDPVHLRLGLGFFVAELRASSLNQQAADGTRVVVDVVDVITAQDGTITRKDTYIGRPHATEEASPTTSSATPNEATTDADTRAVASQPRVRLEGTHRPASPSTSSLQAPVIVAVDATADR